MYFTNENRAKNKKCDKKNNEEMEISIDWQNLDKSD